MTHPHALRSLQRTPVFSIAVIVALVLGIAAVSSMFAIVYGVLLAPLPYGQPDRLVSVGLQTSVQRRSQQPPAVYFTYQQFAQQLDDIGFYRAGSVNVWSEDDGRAAESVMTAWVTASMMPLLQIPPLLGRSFNADEEIRGGPNAVILSEAEWRNRFGAARDVIGKTLIVNDASRQIVGVMPARFSFPTASTRLWLPVKHTDNALVEEFLYAGVARLAPGASAEQAQHELAAVLPRMAEAFPSLHSGSSTATWLEELRPTPVVVPLRDEVTAPIAQTLWMLAAAAALVLFVAWANVANLMLIRADGRQLELAVREAQGASRLRIATHFLGESLLLGATAGAIALLVTFAAIRALVAFGPADVPRLAELGVGPTTVLFIVLLTLLSVIVCAAVPALRVRRASLSSSLRDGGRGETTGASRQRLRASIIVVQIALALVVSIGSALLLRTVQSLYEVHPGFDADEVTTLRILLPHASYRDASTVDFYARLTERVGRLPSVHAAGLTGQLPLSFGWPREQTIRIEGEGQTRALPVNINVIGNGYFDALRIPLLAGRDFFSLDRAQGGDIIISQRAAATLFGDASDTGGDSSGDASGVAAVGKHLTLGPNGPTYTVVGIVGDVHDRELGVAPSAMIYRPQSVPIDPKLESGPRASLTLVVRSSEPASAVVPAIRQIVQDLDPAVPLFDVETMSDVVSASFARLSFALTLMAAAAVITLLLGMIGLYGVMAYMVALRTREFGIRIALGANPRRIARWVVSHGLALTAGGIVAGFVLYALAAPFLRAFLYGVTTADPLTLAGATLVLAATASLASWFPARRAARVDPAVALRAD